ncbi:unnamed protein product [Mytilus edulis]|uniref:Uncharacterized protein n=1 Tax=Mytilus edulis TaxID=6550 RepID=A0A8S3U259_MYTED|nr:unnamed protein product [Mytilus edulis]
MIKCYFYKNKSAIALLELYFNGLFYFVKNVEWFGLDKGLLRKLAELPDQTIPYGCIEVISTDTKRLSSHYEDDVQGVIRNIALIEHKSKRNNGVWSDVQIVFVMLQMQCHFSCTMFKKMVQMMSEFMSRKRKVKVFYWMISLSPMTVISQTKLVCYSADLIELEI